MSLFRLRSERFVSRPLCQRDLSLVLYVRENCLSSYTRDLSLVQIKERFVSPYLFYSVRIGDWYKKRFVSLLLAVREICLSSLRSERIVSRPIQENCLSYYKRELSLVQIKERIVSP